MCQKPNSTCFKCNQEGYFANECPNQASVAKPDITCYKCGKPGHISRNCKTPAPTTPILKLTGPVAAPAQPKARTFNMTMKDAIQDVDVVAGTLLINSVNVKVLIDSGSSKSFISREFVDKLNYEVEPLEKPVHIIASEFQ